MRYILLFVIFGFIAAAGSMLAVAQAPEPIADWEKRQNAEERLTVFGEDIMGEAIDPHTGSITFTHTDVSIPGNNSLPVAVTRRRSQGFLYHDSVDAEFGDWELVVPRIKVTTIPTWTGNRCSQSFSQSFPNVPDGSNPITRSTYSNGVMMDIPGMSPQELLENPQGNQWPTNATHVTEGNFYLYCGSASDGGQGFIAKAPNGDTYRFDRYIKHRGPNLYMSDTYGKTRHVEMLAATEVTDVHGNWVRYTYDSSNRLTRIHSNDGRDISLSYQGSSLLVDEVSTNGRTWSYDYARSDHHWAIWDYWPEARINQQTLVGVDLPDARSWSINLDLLHAEPAPARDCPGANITVSLTHPSGLLGTFKLKQLEHRYIFAQAIRQNQDCPMNEPEPPPSGPSPPIYPLEDAVTTRVVSVTQKRLSGDGVPSSTWNYTYEQDTGPSGSSGSDRTNWTKVSGPGVHITYIHNWVSEIYGGSLAEKEIRSSSGGPVLQSETYTNTQEDRIGTPLAGICCTPGSTHRGRPDRTTQSVLERGGVTYTTTRTFDSNFSSSTYSFGNPTSQSASSTLGSGTRTTDTTYDHNTTKWILGLPLVQTTNGKALAQFTYDSDGQMLTFSRVGQLKATMAYDSQGLLTSVKDGINRETLINSYHRGVPTSLTRPDGVTVTRTVDNNGWVTSQTDGNGVTTSFGHNSMGWLTLVDRVSPWSDTVISYSGLGAGVVQTSTRGDVQSVTTYDRYHRPTTTQKTDLTGVASDIHHAFTYDGLGRTVFASLPSGTPTPTLGVSTTYDGLGRMLTQTNTGDATVTSYTYGPNNSVSVTDPEGHTTTTLSSGFASPDDGNPLSIAQPESVTTTMTYDIWGNLLTATQGGVTQEWRYDQELRLCRHYAPETGSTLQKYNAADEPIWRSEGQTITSGHCSNAPGSTRVYFTYDLMGRVTQLNYPTGTHDVTMSYDNNGNMLTNNRGGANWTYTYNTANLVTGETLTIDGQTFALNYGYTSDEALNWEVTPKGTTIHYAPDGFGRPTGTLLNGAHQIFDNGSYHPSGALQALDSANGHSYSASFDSRHMMSGQGWSKTGVTATDFTYTRDDNGRITFISDGAVPGNNRSFTYDDLGRLEAATGAWGSASYTYDTVNNITQKTLGTRTVEMDYDSNNRLFQFRDTAEANVWQAVFYDDRGNVRDTGLVAHGGLDFVYDHANQPISMTGAHAGTFQYDGNYKRVKQSNPTTIYSVYNLAGQLKYRFEASTGDFSEFISLGGMTVARRENGGAVTRIHSDHLGSPVAATDVTGTVLWREEYTPFGEKWVSASSNDDNMSYTGHIHDSTISLTYMQARFYDPVIGRFLSNDPMGFADMGGDPGYMNRYWYAGGDPMNAWDPDGRACESASRTEAGGGGTTCTSYSEFDGDVSAENTLPQEQTQTADNVGTPEAAQWEEVENTDGMLGGLGSEFDFVAGDTIRITANGTIKAGLDPVEIFVTAKPRRSETDMEGGMILRPNPPVPEYQGLVGSGLTFDRVITAHQGPFGNRWIVQDRSPFATGNSRTVYLRVYVPAEE